MNKQKNNFNFFNFRNLLLIILSFIFIILSSATLITQRSNNMETLPYLNTYIVISSLFILALIVSISFIIFPIILRVRRKKISTNLKEHIEIIEELNIDKNLRAENISVEDYCKLANRS